MSAGGREDSKNKKHPLICAGKKKKLDEPDGGDKRDRTADLLNAIQALSQLSYTPILGFVKFLFMKLWSGVQLWVRRAPNWATPPYLK